MKIKSNKEIEILHMTSQNIGLKACDRDDVLAAVKQKGDALLYASVDLRMNKGFILEAVKQNGGPGQVRF